MTNVLIIEDERLAAEKMEKMVVSARKDWHVIGYIDSVNKAVAWLGSNTPPDLILMDIQLADGISFEIFEQIQVQSPVIFVTAFDQFAIKAFKVNSIDYLLKPVDPVSLENALRKFERLKNSFVYDISRIAMLNQQIAKTYKNRFLVKVGTAMVTVLTSDIELLFICERSLFLQTFAGKTYGIDYSMEQIQNMVDPDQFYRVNRNFMVNIIAVVKLVSYSASRIKLELIPPFKGDEIIVAREKVTDFKRWIDR